MRAYGRTSVHEFPGDSIVFRNLTPVDERLPSLDVVREKARVPKGVTPRKTEPAYARVIVELLRAGRRIEAPRTTLQRLIYVGDTRMNDGTAFANIAVATVWPALAFIASEKVEPGPPEIAALVGETENEAMLYLANRWAALGEFEAFCEERR